MMHSTPSNEILEYCKNAAAFVEATNNEQSVLWERWSIEAVGTSWYAASPAQPDLPRYRWKMAGHGLLPTVGHFYQRPICICLSKAEINQQVVIFWEPTSDLIDHTMIGAYLDRISVILKITPNRVDAANFHNALR